MKNNKQFKSIDEQIIILKSRGVNFLIEDRAKELLKKYNYFDIINGFENILLTDLKQKKYDNIYFEDFFNMYNFDTEIRILTLKLIFDIEARLKTSIAYNFAKIYCNDEKSILNYTNRFYYQIPSKNNNYLFKTFMRFELFRKEEKMQDGASKLGFIEKKKKDYEYIRHYSKPPFWVVIKSFNFGELYFTYSFLKEEVKIEVLNDFQLSISDDSLFQQILHVLKHVRNLCAHIELITNFHLYGTKELDNFRALKKLTSSTRKKITFYDVCILLSKFCDISDVISKINDFSNKMQREKKEHLLKKLFKRMGNEDINKWKNLKNIDTM